MPWFVAKRAIADQAAGGGKARVPRLQRSGDRVHRAGWDWPRAPATRRRRRSARPKTSSGRTSRRFQRPAPEQAHRVVQAPDAPDLSTSTPAARSRGRAHKATAPARCAPPRRRSGHAAGLADHDAVDIAVAAQRDRDDRVGVGRHLGGLDHVEGCAHLDALAPALGVHHRHHVAIGATEDGAPAAVVGSGVGPGRGSERRKEVARASAAWRLASRLRASGGGFQSSWLLALLLPGVRSPGALLPGALLPDVLCSLASGLWRAAS